MKIYNITIRVVVQPTFQGKDLEEAKLVSEIIRCKIHKTLDELTTVKQWCIDKPNEAEY